MPSVSNPEIHCAHDEIRAIDALVEHPRNPNKHPPEQLRLLGKIIRANGWRSPICVSARSGFVIKGHGRLQAARLAGITEAPVDLQNYASEADEWADMIADNRIAELAEIAVPELAGLLRELDAAGEDMERTGFDDDALSELLASIAEEDRETDAEPQIDKAEELRAKWGVALGQVWQLGEHRIACGDSTQEAVVAAVMGGGLADMVLTDPPYGVSYVGKTKDALKVENDDLDECQLTELVKEAFDQAQAISRPGAYWYATVPAVPLHILFADDWKRRGILRQIMVWAKDSMVFGHSEYHYQHEPILFGWVPGPRHQNQDRTRTTLWQYARPKASREHPTMKPVELWAQAVRDGSRPGETVYEPFSGSGTTIIACEQLGRKARAIELNPAYVAVAIQRWVDATGGTPSKING